MLAKNVSSASVRRALAAANEFYDGNLRFASGPKVVAGGGVRFRLSVHSSSAAGARRGVKKKADGTPWRLAFACWHAYGRFFDALFADSPNADVTSKLGPVNPKIGWMDLAIPGHEGLRYSDLCECKGERRHRGAIIFGRKPSDPPKSKRRHGVKERGSLLG